MLKILQAWLQQYVNQNFQMYKMDLEKAEEEIKHLCWQRSNGQHPLDHRNSKGIPAKHLLCFIDYTKDFDCVDNNKLENS